MNTYPNTITRPAPGLLSTHKVLRNTYALLALTLLFSALCAAVAVATHMPPLGILVTLAGYFGLLFLTTRFSNSALGLVCVFALTGFMGLTLGPMLDLFMNRIANGGQLVMMAMGGTGLIFLGLSSYVLTTQKDMSFMGGFLMVGILVAFVASLAGLFFSIPGLALAVSAMMMLLMSGMILYQTSAIVHGGETNYILATVTLFVSIFNLFTSLLHLLGVFGSDE